MQTNEQIRQHLREVQAEFEKARREDRVTHAICVELIRAFDNVERLDLNAAEYANGRE